MKIIISHDVDHWEWKEHITDGFLIKFILKNMFYGLTRKIGFGLAINRIFSIAQGKISQLESLLLYEQNLNVPSTVFVGVSNALGLSYSKNKAQQIINYVKLKKFKVGLHGIEYDDFDKMREEKTCFEELSGLRKIGIRNHYLRLSSNSYKYMAELGYYFDSTLSGIKHLSDIDGMKVFPISIMDVDILSPAKNDIGAIMKKTLDLLKEANDQRQDYFVINFHDNYFSDLYPDHKEWFTWMVNYLKEENYEFTDFYAALSVKNDV